MMANHRPLALTPFDPTYTLHSTCTHSVCVHVEYNVTHTEQLVGQPVTNENMSFGFEFGNDPRLKCWHVQKDRDDEWPLYVHVQ